MSALIKRPVAGLVVLERVKDTCPCSDREPRLAAKVPLAIPKNRSSEELSAWVIAAKCAESDAGM